MSVQVFNVHFKNFTRGIHFSYDCGGLFKVRNVYFLCLGLVGETKNIDTSNNMMSENVENSQTTETAVK